MGSELIRTMGFMVVLAVSAGLMGCPPEEEGPPAAPAAPEVYDIKDYWPMAVGNQWEWLNLTDGTRAVAHVTDDLSSGPYAIWEVVFWPNSADIDTTLVYYFVFHPDFLVYTTEIDYVAELPNDTSNLDVLDEFLLFKPNNIAEGKNPLPERMGRFSDTGTVDDLAPFEECSGTVWEASNFPVSPDTHSILWTDSVQCDDGKIHESVDSWLARNIGPLILQKDFLLLRALIDGVEYPN